MTLVGIILIKAGLEIPMATWIIKGFLMLYHGILNGRLWLMDVLGGKLGER